MPNEALSCGRKPLPGRVPIVRRRVVPGSWGLCELRRNRRDVLRLRKARDGRRLVVAELLLRSRSHRRSRARDRCPLSCRSAAAARRRSPAAEWAAEGCGPSRCGRRGRRGRRRRGPSVGCTWSRLPRPQSESCYHPALLASRPPSGSPAQTSPRTCRRATEARVPWRGWRRSRRRWASWQSGSASAPSRPPRASPCLSSLLSAATPFSASDPTCRPSR
mmetsp:Transcript_102540/g.328536  ORF Transcript_102540/g.328536 Transcript_102540/m.328536 type:complete len:219 (+) Transcript_102540:403-1059(+)